MLSAWSLILLIEKSVSFSYTINMILLYHYSVYVTTLNKVYSFKCEQLIIPCFSDFYIKLSVVN